tara:strand:- start:68 stop:574 length:507 start_codon:yes stop_codon:yes gene_type:complete
MVLNPSSVAQTMITIPGGGIPFDHKSQVQQNGIDLRLCSAMQLMHGDEALNIAAKDMAKRWEVSALDGDTKTGALVLHSGCTYEIRFIEHIKVADKAMGWVRPRSRFVRNGIHMWSGVFDTGFEGQLGCMLHILGPRRIKVVPGERMAQLVMWEADHASLYDGDWKNA